MLGRTNLHAMPGHHTGETIITRLLSGPLIWLLIAVALTACSIGPTEAEPSPEPIGRTLDASPTASPTPSPTPSPAADIDVSTVPDEITVAYVQAVMDALDLRIRNAYADLQSAGDVDEEFVGSMRLLYANSTAEPQIENLRRDGDIGVAGIAADPQPPRTEVLEVLAVEDGCVFFSAERTYEPLLAVEYDPVQPYYLTLVGSGPNDTNPTRWSIGFEVFYPDPGASAPENPCP